MSDSYYVYHIHTPGMSLDEGYIGVSVEPKARWSRHKSKTSDSSDRLKRAIKKYKPKFSILAVFNTLEEALWQEFTLRPFDRMGWNLVQGGGMPPKHPRGEEHPCFGKVTPEETRKKQSEARKGRFGGHEHPRCKPINVYDAETDELIAENVIGSLWAKENGYHQAHTMATASGRLKTHKGIYARYVNKDNSRQT